MARGQQKIQSQQKAAERAQKLKKQQGHDQKSAASKALTFMCVVCKVSLYQELLPIPGKVAILSSSSFCRDVSFNELLALNLCTVCCCCRSSCTGSCYSNSVSEVWWGMDLTEFELETVAPDSETKRLSCGVSSFRNQLVPSSFLAMN